MTICFFGNYNKDYPRIRVLQKGFIQNGVDVIECNTNSAGIKKFIELFKFHKQVKNNYDYLLVTMGSYTLVWFARLLTKKPVIFDVFVSLYLTNIEDRMNTKRKSIKAFYYKYLDKFSCLLADKVLLDTNSQIEYFVNQYGLEREKFIEVPVGTDLDIFFPNSKINSSISERKFIVHWHGYIVPFHGLYTILQTANILKNNEDIVFQIVTRFNSKYESFKKQVDELGLNNLIFYPESTFVDLAKYINESDIALGIFGDNKKGDVVVPNKIFECMACSKSVITAKTEATAEFFENEKNIVFVTSNNPEELSSNILKLKDNEQLRNNIGENAYNLVRQNFSPNILVSNLLKNL